MLALRDEPGKSFELLKDSADEPRRLGSGYTQDLCLIDSRFEAGSTNLTKANCWNILEGGYVLEDENSREAVAAGRPQSQCRVYWGYPGYWDQLSIELGFRTTQVSKNQSRDEKSLGWGPMK